VSIFSGAEPSRRREVLYVHCKACSTSPGWPPLAGAFPFGVVGNRKRDFEFRILWLAPPAGGNFPPGMPLLALVHGPGANSSGAGVLFLAARFQQLRQLGDVGGDATGFVMGQRLGQWRISANIPVDCIVDHWPLK
jgi:hypothetical protein